MQFRRRKPAISLADRLSLFAKKIRQQAESLAPGPERDAVLKKVKRADAAVDLERWASSPELQPPE